jgi:hypothetical protein
MKKKFIFQKDKNTYIYTFDEVHKVIDDILEKANDVDYDIDFMDCCSIAKGLGRYTKSAYSEAVEKTVYFNGKPFKVTNFKMNIEKKEKNHE